MKRILFVDDDPMVLEGLENMLRSERRRWRMVFAVGGTDALAAMEAEPFDIVVSDMRMPKMDGLALLRRTRERFPKTVRIILSGHTELEEMIKSVDIAHQFLSKPCGAAVLKEVLNRTCNLMDLLDEESLCRAIGQISALPTPPRMYERLIETLSAPACTLEDVLEILEQDVAMCAKVLQLVNSAFFGLERPVLGIREALQHLGVNLLKNIVLSVESMEELGGAARLPASAVEEFQTHALLTAHIAARIRPETMSRDEVFTAALLHDIGRLIIAQAFPREGTVASAALFAPDDDSRLHGATHAEIGAYLLGIWGLPHPIVEAVAHHHRPERVAHDGLDVIDVIYLANLLARQHLGLPEAEADFERGLAYLRQLGLEARLPEWRQAAQEAALQLKGVQA